MKTLLRLTLTLLPFAGFAQKADQGPNSTSSGGANPYTTYTIEVHAPDSVLQTIPQATIENALSIHGLQKVTTDPSLTVSFTVQNLIILEEGVKEFTEPQKDSTAKNPRTSYYVQVLYCLKCEGKCTNAQKQVVYSKLFGNGQSKFTSFFMPTRQEAEDYWKNNKESIKGNFITSVINPSLVAMGTKINAGLPASPKN